MTHLVSFLLSALFVVAIAIIIALGVGIIVVIAAIARAAIREAGRPRPLKASDVGVSNVLEFSRDAS